MTDTLAKALVAAQKKMPAIKPNATNPHFKSDFVTLDHLLAKALPVLHSEGLAVAQFPSIGPNGEPALTTMILHESGEKLEAQMPLILPKQDPQGQGSALTYARRYALAAALGISAETDDDANHASSQDAPRVGADTGSSGRGGERTSSPAHPPATPTDGVFRFPSGKHAGKTLDEAGASYCAWYLENGPRDDVKAAILAHTGQPDPNALPDDLNLPL